MVEDESSHRAAQAMMSLHGGLYDLATLLGDGRGNAVRTVERDLRSAQVQLEGILAWLRVMEAAE